MPYPDVPVAHAAAGPLAGPVVRGQGPVRRRRLSDSGGQPFVLAMSGIKTTTAPTVQRLLDAGARFAGKTITDELAFSMNGQNAHFGSPVNGAAPERISGGSSSGSASAVSNCLCDFALGSDTGGSVRAPANHCGLVGLRPTHGRISLELVMDLAPSFDTCGWFARDVATFARVADVLLGADASPLPAKPRLLAPTDVWDLLAPEVRDAQAGPRAPVEPRSARRRRSRGARRLRLDVLELSLPAGPRGLAQRRRADRSLPAAARPRRARPLRLGEGRRRRAGEGRRRRFAAASAPTSRACSAATACS
jgi:amidase